MKIKLRTMLFVLLFLSSIILFKKTQKLFTLQEKNSIIKFNIDFELVK